MSDRPDKLVMMDTGLGSFVACVAAQTHNGPDSSLVRIWGSLRIRASESAFLEHLGGQWLESPKEQPGDRPINTSQSILQAALAAADQGISRVIWPVHAGVPGRPGEMDLDAASRHVDRALLVTRLAAMDAHVHGCASISIETPYADFSDRQLAELALDMGVPYRMASWWGDETSEEFARWRGVFEAIGSLAGA